MRLKVSKRTGTATKRQADDLDPDKKVKDLLDHTTKLWDYLHKLNSGLDFNVGDFFLKYPKTAEARKALEPLRKKIQEAQLSAFRTLGILKKLDKQK